MELPAPKELLEAAALVGEEHKPHGLVGKVPTKPMDLCNRVWTQIALDLEPSLAKLRNENTEVRTKLDVPLTHGKPEHLGLILPFPAQGVQGLGDLGLRTAAEPLPPVVGGLNMGVGRGLDPGPGLRFGYPSFLAQ